MSSIVFDASGNVVRQSHNLRGILEHARGRGVESIRVDQLADTGRPGAFVSIEYRGRHRGQTYFVCGSHAAEWARRYAAMSPRVSWFAGAAVDIVEHKPGAWDYAANKPKGGTE